MYEHFAPYIAYAQGKLARRVEVDVASHHPTIDPVLPELREALARRKAQLSEEEQQQIVERARALEERQHRKDDDSILPKVDLSDVPLQMPEPESRYDGDMAATVFARGTNGLVYEQIILPVPALTREELLLLPQLPRAAAVGRGACPDACVHGGRHGR